MNMNYGSIKITRLKILIITLFITAPLLANTKTASVLAGIVN